MVPVGETGCPDTPSAAQGSRVLFREVDAKFLEHYFGAFLNLHRSPTWVTSRTLEALNQYLVLSCGQRLYATILLCVGLPGDPLGGLCEEQSRGGHKETQPGEFWRCWWV